VFEEAMGEAHVPTEQPQAQAQARLPAPDADATGPGGARSPAVARPQEPLRLIWRVRHRREFAALRQGAPVRRRLVSVKRARLGATGTPPRVSYAIGRDLGSAPVRNRLRRRLREVVRLEADKLDPDTGYLIMARSGLERLTPGELRTEIGELLGRYGRSSPRKPAHEALHD
jgi:ribonuclease P protein component